MPDTSLRRQMEPEEIRCEAGQLIGDANCLCGIEGAVIDGYEDPTSIDLYCAGAYDACPTWKAAKKIESLGGDLRRILASQQEENSHRRSQTALRDARLRAAQERIVSDTPEGRALRRRFGIPEAA